MATKKEILENTIKRCKQRNIIIPTYEEMRDPEKIPQGIKNELKKIGLWDLNSRNLFRITWKNEPVKSGGGFNGVNHMEIPSSLSGVKARIIILLGKFFPTGAHKVGATFGPLVERLVKGEFDPTTQKALWPSTGNYCRGGAYDSYLLACPSIAVLPEGMSKERFTWLKKIGSEVHATPGVESNVKEVFDKTYELKQERPEEVVVLNQFDEIGNPIWHYAVTGAAMEELYHQKKKKNENFTALFLTQGSAGTLGCGDYIRAKFPSVKVGAGEAWQCPTLLYNGFGGHRIEGIGDKHVPWIFNVKNLDMVADIDDDLCIRMIRLFNEKSGRSYLEKKMKIDHGIVGKLDLLGISSIANLVGAIKMARYYEMDSDDMIFTIATDSMELYQSRIEELRKEYGDYNEIQAARDFESFSSITTDRMLELSYWDKKRMHNLKYFTWIEQRGKSVEELDEQWYNKNYWKDQYNSYKEWDKKIKEFNERTGLLRKY